ncbi:MAG: hypothetical protein R3A48_00740 [Polyangiales bacterium]
MVHLARRLGAAAVRAGALLFALSLAVAGCAPGCAAADETREVLRREGAGWRLVATCTTTTRLGLDRREGPLFRGCGASGRVTLETDAMSRASALAGCSMASRDCREARRYCAAARAEVAERVIGAARLVGVSSAGARDTTLFGISAAGVVLRYPVDYSARPLREAVARAPDPETLVMALARTERLSPVSVGWAEEVGPLFDAPFVRRHLGELVALAGRCALHPELVARLLREGGEAALAPLLARASSDPSAPRCRALDEALARSRAAAPAPPDAR